MKHLNPILGGALVASALASVAPAMAQDTLPIAAQMFTLRDFGTLKEQLDALNRAGVSNVETVDVQEVPAEELKALLDEHGIKAISSHVPLEKLRTDLDSVIEEQKLIGNPVITVPWLPEDQRPTDAAGWTALGEEIGGYADTLVDAGFDVAYHNHDFEMVEFDGQTALEILLEAAGDNVDVELDVAWVARAGFDPAEFLPRLDGRLFAIHAKDNAEEGTAEDERGFATLGTGVLDWDTILPAAHAAGAQWFILEHDQPLNAEDVITEGNAFLTERLPAVLVE